MVVPLDCPSSLAIESNRPSAEAACEQPASVVMGSEQVPDVTTRTCGVAVAAFFIKIVDVA